MTLTLPPLDVVTLKLVSYDTHGWSVLRLRLSDRSGHVGVPAPAVHIPQPQACTTVFYPAVFRLACGMIPYICMA